MTGYQPAAADRLLRDGDRVSLGGSALVCHLTPGHTKGCTTWTMDVEDDGKVRHVLFYGSTTVLEGVSLLNNPKYPNIVEDYLGTFKTLKTLPCDVFLAPHASFFGLADKMARNQRGEKPNPFIAPNEFSAFVENAERLFMQRLQEERKQLGG
jgi:metallo-beta-lactamase class B